MTKIISISLSEEEKLLIDTMELSPTGLFKQKIREVKANASNYQKLLTEKSEIIERLNFRFKESLEFIQSKNLSDEYTQFISKK